MSDKVRFALVLAAAWGCVVAAVAAVLALAVADLPEREAAAFVPVLRDRAPAIVVGLCLLLLPLALAVRALMRHFVTAPRQLAEDARIMLVANPAHRVPARGAAGTRALAATLNDFAEANAALQRDVEQQIREANDRIAQARQRRLDLQAQREDARGNFQYLLEQQRKQQEEQQQQDSGDPSEEPGLPPDPGDLGADGYRPR